MSVMLRRSAPALLLLAGACSLDVATPSQRFLQGTASNPLIVTTVLSLSNTLLQVQAGAPTVRQSVALGSSTQITPVGFAIRGTIAAIPAGNASAVLVGDLENALVSRVFTWPSGNATGLAWFDDNTFFTTNPSRNLVGRVTGTQIGNDIRDTVRVAAYPTDVVVTAGRVFVVSSNLDANFSPAGPGVVTELNPATNAVVRTFQVGRNPQYAAAFGGKLFVTNSGDFGSNNGTVSVIDLATNTVAAPVTGFGDFPGPITIDASGRAFISSFATGTIVWNTQTGAFVRGPSNAVCVLAGTACRGASGAQVGTDGKLYQAVFGSSSANQGGRIFVFDGTTFALQDSIAVPVGATGVDVRSFR